jgi:hypothetical protein
VEVDVPARLVEDHRERGGMPDASCSSEMLSGSTRSTLIGTPSSVVPGRMLSPIRAAP